MRAVADLMVGVVLGQLCGGLALAFLRHGPGAWGQDKAGQGRAGMVNTQECGRGEGEGSAGGKRKEDGRHRGNLCVVLYDASFFVCLLCVCVCVCVLCVEGFQGLLLVGEYDVYCIC